MDPPTPVGHSSSPIRLNTNLREQAAGLRRSALSSGMFGISCTGSLRHVRRSVLRRDKPRNRGALKNVKRSFEFFEEVTCTPDSQRLTKTDVYQLMLKEILVSAEPGRRTKQAPRMFLCVIAGLENLVVSQGVSPFLRFFSWWICLQHWGDAEVRRP